MIRDTRSNSFIAAVLPANDFAAGDHPTASVDHSIGNACAFLISAGVVGGTIDGKLQYSDDNTVWVDDDGASGNNINFGQVTAPPGNGECDVVNPRARYSRVMVTVGGANSTLSVTGVLNPRRTIVPEDK